MSEPNEFHDDFTGHERDAELAARLNEITNGAGTLMLALPMEYVAGRGYEAILSRVWSGTTAYPSLSTYYDRRKHAGAVLREGRWEPEHSIEDERRHYERMAEYHGRYVTSAQSRLAALTEDCGVDR